MVALAPENPWLPQIEANFLLRSRHVQHHQYRFLLIAAQIRHNIWLVFVQGNVFALSQRWVLMAQGEHVLVKLQNGIGIVEFSVYVVSLEAWRDR